MKRRKRSCQPDSGKHAVTAADGIFLIDGVDPNAQFKVYVEAKGFRGRALILDPRAPRPLVEFKLVANPPMQEDRHRFLGQVLLPDGTPAVGVAVVTHNVQPFVPSGARYDTQATTDEEGRFVLTSEQAWQAMTVAVEAPGCAKGRLFPLKAGPRGNTLQLDYGSTITGRVFHKARPAKGVRVALVAIPVAVVNRVVVVGQPQTSIAPITSTTDADGRFAFEQVLSDSMYYLYTPMRGMLDENLAAIVREIRSPGGGQTREIGEVNLHPAHRVSGKIILSDQDAPPDDTYAVLERLGVGDIQETRVDGQGRFSFDAVPSEIVVLSFHSGNQKLVMGYRLSSGNLSFDPLSQCTLRGHVDEDRRLNVLFEPGSSQAYTPGDAMMQNQNALARRQVRVVVIKNGQRVIQQVGTVSSTYYEKPLSGVSDDVVARLRQKAP